MILTKTTGPIPFDASVLDDQKLRFQIRWCAERLCKNDRGHYCADDLEQVGLTMAARAAARYDPSRGASLRTWCLNQARDYMLNEHLDQQWLPRWKEKKLRHDREQWPVRITRFGDMPHADEHPMDVSVPISDEPTEEDVNQSNQRVADLLSVLSDRERSTFVGRVYQRRTLIDLAREQGCSIERVRQVDLRARQKLRDRYRPDGTIKKNHKKLSPAPVELATTAA